MGEIILSFDENYLAKLYFCGKQKRGGVKEYTDKMYEFLLTVKITLIQCNVNTRFSIISVKGNVTPTTIMLLLLWMLPLLRCGV